MNASYKLTAVLFGIGVTLHNPEEAMYLAGWARSHLKLRFEPNPRIFWFLTSLVSVVVWVPIIGVCVSKNSTHFQSALSGFALAMAISAVIPHLDHPGEAFLLAGNGNVNPVQRATGRATDSCAVERRRDVAFRCLAGSSSVCPVVGLRRIWKLVRGPCNPDREKGVSIGALCYFPAIPRPDR